MAFLNAAITYPSVQFLQTHSVAVSRSCTICLSIMITRVISKTRVHGI